MSKSTAPTLKKKGGGFKGKRRDKRRSESKNLSVPLQVGERKMPNNLVGMCNIRSTFARLGACNSSNNSRCRL